MAPVPPYPVPSRDPWSLRAGDADRDRVADALREAAGEGRLSLGELDERLDRALTARTYGELAELTRDLPSHSATTAALAPIAPQVERITALMSEQKRRGRWELPALLKATAVMGSVELDLSEAVVRHSEVVIDATAVMGNVHVRVPDGVDVRLEPGPTVMGTRQLKLPATEVQPGGPVIRVRGTVVMGEVVVRPSRRPWWPRRAVSG